MLRAPSGRVLFLKRSPSEGNFANHWALPGGGVDAGESHEDAARRECREEIGFRCGSLKPHYQARNGYVTFLSDCAGEFEPRLNGEHTNYVWRHADSPPHPLHPGVSEMLDVSASRSMAGDAEKNTHPFPIESSEERRGRLSAQFAHVNKFYPRYGAGGEVFTTEMQRRHYPRQNVPLDKVVSTQTYLDPFKVEKYKKSKTTKPPIAHKFKGKYYISDGHHHAVAAHESGVTHMMMHVSDLDKLPQAADAMKKTKSAVSYEPDASDQDHQCRACDHFVTPGSCERVEGRISPIGWCRLWTKMGAEDARREPVGPKKRPSTQSKSWKRWTSARYVNAGKGVSKPARKPLAADEMPAYGLLARPGEPFALALDRESVRAKDEDGHLHVKVTPISKATVNPYLGREIPYWEELGLEPDKIYKLLRDPRELKKAAPTFSGKPLLIVHKPLNAGDHPHEKVIGAVGTSPKFDGKYVQAPLTVWTQQAINLIESGKQKELSSGYRYRADMTPGVYKGMKYDGVMRDIRGNHVAIVVEGRAGPDVVVGDSKENIKMRKVLLSPKAAQVQGALTAFLAPLLAEDESVDLTRGLRSITIANYDKKIPLLAEYVAEKVKGRLKSTATLASDASPEGLKVLLEALSDVSPTGEPAKELGMREQGEEPADGPPENDAAPEEMGGMEPDDESEPSEEEDQEGEDPGGEYEAGGEEEGGEQPEYDDPDDGGGEESSGIEGIKEFLRSELSPEAFERLEQMLAALGDGEGEASAEEGEEGETPEEDEAPDDDMLDEEEPTEEEDQTGEDEPPMFRGRPKISGKDRNMNKGAMDEATVKGLVTAAVQAERAAQKALQNALRDVRPYVGELMGCDSAEQAYVKALGIKGVKPDVLKGATVGIMQQMLKMQPLKSSASRSATPVAQDSKTASTYSERFPEAARIGHA